jgi:small ligand-binding sensory domain FIST
LFAYAYAHAHAYASKQELSPQVFASGYSPQLDLLEAIQEATNIALQALPKPEQDAAIDLALITVSSLYDGQSQPSVVVPAVLRGASVYGTGVQNLIGCTTGGIVASVANLDMPQTTDNYNEVQPKACSTVESEGVPGVSVTLCLLPNVTVKV